MASFDTDLFTVTRKRKERSAIEHPGEPFMALQEGGSMFIRWKQYVPRNRKWYKHYKEIKGEDGKWRRIPKTEEEKITRIYAYLCTSVRAEGKVRQKAIYLAGIDYHSLSQVGHQASFWRTVVKKLDALSLSVEQRQSIEVSLLKRIPKPSPEAVAQAGVAFHWLSSLSQS